MNYNSILLHIPHSNLNIPNVFGLSIDTDCELRHNVLTHTDLYTNDLFNFCNVDNVFKHEFKYNRFYCDVERYWNDENELMSTKGQGVYYTHYKNGDLIERIDNKEDIKYIYDEHHNNLNMLSKKLVEQYNNCLIIDCHSFNDSFGLPDICIGLNNNIYDISKDKLRDVISIFKTNGYSVSINHPYGGSIYPSEYNSLSLNTVMIEVNKRCYLSGFEKDLEKFNKLKKTIEKVIFFLL